MTSIRSIPRVSLNYRQRFLGLSVPTDFVVLVAWLPLFVMTVLDHRAFGGRTSFFEDAGVQVRLLFTLPVMLSFKAYFDARVEQVLDYAAGAGMIGGSRGRLPQELQSCLQLFESPAATMVVALAAYAVSVIGIASPLPHDIESWKFNFDQRSVAGWYFALVSAPLSNIVILSWLWRWIVWALVLFRLSRKLELSPNHADAAAGVQPIATVSIAFAPMLSGLSALLSAASWTTVHRGLRPLADFKATLVTFIILAPTLIIVPLLGLMPAMMRAKRDNLIAYGSYASGFAQRYWGHISRRQSDPTEVADDAISSDTDLGSSHERLRKSSVFPISKDITITLLAATILPMLLMLAALLPSQEFMAIAKNLRGLVTGE